MKPTMRFPWAGVILGIICWAVVIWLCGCGMKSYHRKAWDEQNNIKEQVDISLVDGLLRTKVQDIAVISNDTARLLFVGEFSQIPDAESVKAVSAGFFETMLRLFFIPVPGVMVGRQVTK